MSKRNKLVVALSVILCVILVLHTVIYLFFLKPNCIGLNYTPKINSSTTIEMCQNGQKKRFKQGDAQFEKIKSIISGKIVKPHVGVVLDSNAYCLILINGDTQHKYYFAFDGKGNDVTVVAWDFAEGKDTVFALEHPYYIVATISMKEFKEIIPDFNEDEFFSKE